MNTGLCICELGFGGPDCSLVDKEELDEDTLLLDAVDAGDEGGDDGGDGDDDEGGDVDGGGGDGGRNTLKPVNDGDARMEFVNYQDVYEEEESDLPSLKKKFGQNLVSGGPRRKKDEINLDELSECKKSCS